jgi:hypothetical protein
MKDDGGWFVYKPSPMFNNQNAVLHTYTFADGTTRQWFFTGNVMGSSGEEDWEEEMKKNIESRRRQCAANEWCGGKDFFFVAHPDDKVFYRHRLVQSIYGGGRGFETNTVLLHNNIQWKHSPLHTIKSVVICETWVKWGGMELLLDGGLRKWNSRDMSDSMNTNYAPRKGKFLPLTEFRASPHYNPFDEPDEPELKEMRNKRIEMKEEIAQKVFHPTRVEKMCETYGEDWMERV